LEHLTISGVAIHSPYDDVPAKLGNPKQLEDGVFEFPGHIIVDVEDGKVDRIEGDVIERDGRKIISRESFREDVVRQLGPPDSPPETKDSIDYFSTSGYNVFIELTPTAKGLRVSRVMLRAKRR